MITLIAMTAMYFMARSQGDVYPTWLFILFTVVGLIIEGFIWAVALDKPTGIDTK